MRIKEVVNGSNVSDSKGFSLKTANETEIKNLRNLDVKRTSGIDTIPPKLVKLSANFLALLLMKTINMSITQMFFQ